MDVILIFTFLLIFFTVLFNGLSSHAMSLKKAGSITFEWVICLSSPTNAYTYKCTCTKKDTHKSIHMHWDTCVYIDTHTHAYTHRHT